MGGDRLADAGHLVTGQIVEQNDVIWAQRRGEHLFDVGTEARAVDGAVEHIRRGDPGAAQPGHQRGHFPMSVWHRRRQAQAARDPAMAAGHVGGGPGFVDEHQAAGVERRLAANEDPPLFGYVGPILLGGAETLF